MVCEDDGSGCGCGTSGEKAAPLFLFGLLGLALIRRRK
ncbi:MAG: MYXO-CTERM sorting domain-containing protein [Deltaproteobacteria bacterium]|nr:MYXO-CTERM sorting domain-containing protein [Deltaproteobacteria bacterium]